MLLAVAVVQILVQSMAQDLVATEDLEQVEFDVAEVALVVAHGPSPAELVLPRQRLPDG